MTALAIIVGIVVILAVLYFAGVFRKGTTKHEIDVNINKPSVVLQLPYALRP